MELLLKRHVLQFVRLVCTIERAVAFPRHKPQTQYLSGFLDQADDRQIGIPFIQNLAGAFAHRRTPLIRGAGRLHNAGGADELDALNTRECVLDGFRVASTGVALQPAQHETKFLFGARRFGPKTIRDAQPRPFRRRQESAEETLQPSREHYREDGNEPSSRFFQQFHDSLDEEVEERRYSQITSSPSCMNG